MSFCEVMNVVKRFFSEVFKRHTEDDAEQVVIVGAIGTIPDPDTLTSECPRPWLYSRVFMFFFLVTVLLFVANVLTNPGQFSNVFVVGAFAVPFTVLVFFFEFNVFKNISFYTVLKALFIGGAMSLIATAVLPSFWFQGITSVSDAFVSGIGEEVAKLLVVYWILKRNRAYPYVLNGILVGAAVGAGFAIFETASYCMNFLLGGDNSWVGKDSMFVLALRNLLAPGGHVVWAAISGAGLLLSARREPLSAGMLRRKTFLAAFLVSVVLHVLWDMPFFESEWVGVCHMLSLTFIAWGIVAWFLRRGLEEVDARRAVVLYRPESESIANVTIAGPWIRWAARSMDLMCNGLLVLAVLHKICEYFRFDEYLGGANDTLLSIVVLPFLLLSEIVFYELFGTTFGKWLFSLRVCDGSGRTASTKAYFKRLLRLWASGLGLCLPIMSLIAPAIQYRRLSLRGQTTYDASLGLRVAKGKLHPFRWLAVLPVLLVLGLLAMATIFFAAGEEEPQAADRGDARLRRIVSSAELNCNWTEEGICVIPFEGVGGTGRTQTCLVYPVRVASAETECLFACSLTAESASVGRPEIDDLLTANAEMDVQQWCKVGDRIALRALMPIDVSPQKFREVVARLAVDADRAEQQLTGNDEF